MLAVNRDGAVALPVDPSTGSIDWNSIPTASPPPGFEAPPEPAIDPFLTEEDKADAFARWISGDGAGCGSAQEFLLKAEAAFGCGEEWLAVATERGFPLVQCLRPNMRLVADLIRNTKVFGWMKFGPAGFASLMRFLLAPSTGGPDFDPGGAFEAMLAFFERGILGSGLSGEKPESICA